MPVKVCSSPDCPNLQPCPDHSKPAWSGSKRRERTRLSGSRQQKRAHFILQRDDLICHVCGRLGADEVDHIVPVAEGGADDLTNLAAIHSTPCHADKTKAEAARARKRAE